MYSATTLVCTKVRRTDGVCVLSVWQLTFIVRRPRYINTFTSRTNTWDRKGDREIKTNGLNSHWIMQRIFSPSSYILFIRSIVVQYIWAQSRAATCCNMLPRWRKELLYAALLYFEGWFANVVWEMHGSFPFSVLVVSYFSRAQLLYQTSSSVIQLCLLEPKVIRL